jgi:hypothetical protein
MIPRALPNEETGVRPATTTDGYLFARAYVVPAVIALALLVALRVSRKCSFGYTPCSHHARSTLYNMRSITTTTLAMDDSLNSHDPFPLDPSLEHSGAPDSHFFAPQSSYPASAFAIPPNPAMDLQYILSPSIILDEQQQQQHHSQSQLVFQSQPQLVHPSAQLSSPPVPSSSRPNPVTPVPPPVVRRPVEHVHPNPDDSIISFDSKVRVF